MDAEDRKAYDARTALIVKQFDAYKPLPDQAINGKLTLGENIGDLGGIKIAYAAMEKALAGKPEARTRRSTGSRPSSASSSPTRRSGAASTATRRCACSSTRTRTARATGARIGPPSNLPEFYGAFGCGEGTPMHRADAERPSIW